MQITAMIWNIETLGCYQGAHQNTYANSMNIFLGSLIRYLRTNDILNVDVLVVEELRAKGETDLAAIQNLISADGWGYDYLPGGIEKATPNPGICPMPAGAISSSDLSFTGTSNSEGYAVLFELGALEPFPAGWAMSWHSTLPAGKGTGFINLCMAGVEPKYVKKGIPPIQPKNARPRSCVPAEFPKPNPSEIDVGIHYREENVLSWGRARRPAWVRIKGERADYDLIVYHAPVSANGPVYGTCACGLVWPVQSDVNHPNTIAAGDFNLTASKGITNSTKNFTDKGMVAGTKIPGTDQYLGTTVHPEPTDPHLDPDTTGNYIGSARDLLFYRLPNATPGSIVANRFDLLDFLIQNPGFSNDVVAGRGFKTVVTQAVVDWIYPQIFNKNADAARDLGRLFDETDQGVVAFEPATAAMFVKAFISDHLPLTITFDG